MGQGRGPFTISLGDYDTQWEVVDKTVNVGPTTTERGKKILFIWSCMTTLTVKLEFTGGKKA